jgi:hypothetical protein
MSTHPETAAESADSNICICCKRSKSGGSFFEIRPDYRRDSEGVSHGFRFEYGNWSANIDVFQKASRQGCQRCTLAFDMVTTWMENHSRSDWRRVNVLNTRPYQPMVAEVLVYFSKSRIDYRRGVRKVALELLSASRKCPK